MTEATAVVYYPSSNKDGFVWEVVHPDEVAAFVTAGWATSPAHFSANPPEMPGGATPAPSVSPIMDKPRRGRPPKSTK